MRGFTPIVLNHLLEMDRYPQSLPFHMKRDFPKRPIFIFGVIEFQGGYLEVDNVSYLLIIQNPQNYY